uniref:Uncharacterized protein n=1 Tax=viral metagenome TaxID=1070528 RepID=A0A6C0D586_9ZZZZ
MFLQNKYVIIYDKEDPQRKGYVGLVKITTNGSSIYEIHQHTDKPNYFIHFEDSNNIKDIMGNKCKGWQIYYMNKYKNSISKGIIHSIEDDVVKLENIDNTIYTPMPYIYTHDIKDIDSIMITNNAFDIVPFSKL